MNWTPLVKHIARKAHRCSLCDRVIEPGETYSRQRGFDGDWAWTFKCCMHCQAVTDLYDPRYWDEGAIDAEAFEDWSTGGMSLGVIGIAELRAMAGYRLRWRARSGRLLPIPGAAA